MGEIRASLWMQRLYCIVFTSYSTFSFPLLHAMPEVLYFCVCFVWLTHNCIVEIVRSWEILDIWLWNNWCFWLLENCWRLFTLIWWLLLGWWGGSFPLVLSILEGTEDFVTSYFLSVYFSSKCIVNSESCTNWPTQLTASLESLTL